MTSRQGIAESSTAIVDKTQEIKTNFNKIKRPRIVTNTLGKLSIRLVRSNLHIIFIR